MAKMMPLVEKTKTFWSIKPDVQKLMYSGRPAKMDIDGVTKYDLCYLGNIAKTDPVFNDERINILRFKMIKV